MPSITESIGRVLGGRYRLVTPLGTGASAHVYLADDVSLHRQVAIKVLHPALAGDAAFLKRFRAEARVVAALNHPNILAVHDWGEDEGEPYLVLEYLAGGSLREIYDSGVLLTPEQATRIGLEAAFGLDYAHRRGLVHRDIKPANLLFDGEGRLRIADFGLARALAEAAWTEPEGAVLGTARYAAPEQVEGLVLDGKSDVYALALVLYEGLTGRAAFVGDTTLATLMARVGTLLPEDEALGPLTDILVWAAAPDPGERYDAAQLIRRLQALSAALPPPAALPLVGDEADAGPLERRARRPLGKVVARVGDETELGFFASPSSPAEIPAEIPTRSQPTGMQPTGMQPTGRSVPLVSTGRDEVSGDLFADVPGVVDARPAVDDDPPVHRVGRTGGRDATGLDESGREAFAGVQAEVDARPGQSVAPIGVYDFEAGGAGNDPDAPAVRPGMSKPAPSGAAAVPRRARRRWVGWVSVAVVALLVAAAVAVVSVTKVLLPSHPVPALVGLSVEGARQAVAADHFTVAVTAHAASITVPLGRVITQRPAAFSGGVRTTAKQGSVIDLTVSAGPPPVALPNLATYATCTAATQALAAVHLVGTCPPSAARYSATVVAGAILSWSPVGHAPYGSTVVISVSKGHAPVVVPTVAGGSYPAAASALTAVGLVPVKSLQYSSTVPVGQVMGTTPASGTSAPFGGHVTVAVSLGPQPVIIPNVIGESPAAAAAALRALGLQVAGPYGPAGAGAVQSTVPAAGSSVARGATVYLYTL